MKCTIQNSTRTKTGTKIVLRDSLVLQPSLHLKGNSHPCCQPTVRKNNNSLDQFQIQSTLEGCSGMQEFKST